ncbi:30S ribosomal protein S11 [bacterium]|nr:30S ribosomal protein S11 [bacterium]
MGKKRVIKRTKEEILAEGERINKAVRQDIKAKTSKRVEEGRIYIISSYNNTIVSLTDKNGNVIVQKSAGSIGFKGTKKGTSFAASRVAQVISTVADKLKLRRVHIFVKGIGGGRDSALRSFVNHGFDILSIRDVTPIPHNGCRPRKTRRV